MPASLSQPMGTWESRILSTDDNDIIQWRKYFLNLPIQEFYSLPDYVKYMGEIYKNQVEAFIYGDDQNYVIHSYFKNCINDMAFYKELGSQTQEGRYYDLTTSWYYGGPMLVISDVSLQKQLLMQFISAFDHYCLENNYVSEFIRYDPILENHLLFEQLLNIERNKEIVYIDLTEDEETIWNEMEKRCRTSIRKAIKAGVTVRKANCRTDIEAFSKIYQQEMERKKAPEHYRFSQDFFLNFFNIFQNQSTLFVAEFDGKIIGGTMLTHRDSIVHDYLMASMIESWIYQPNNLLLYEAILWSKRQGYSIFDLQGGRDKVYKFKKAFSPHTKGFFVGKIIHDELLYEKLCKMRDEFDSLHGIPEIDLASKDFFPAYRRRELV